MSKYYAAVSGLPNLAVEDRRLPYSPTDFVDELEALLTTGDRKLLHLLLLEDENQQLAIYLEDKAAERLTGAKSYLFDYEEIDAILEAHRDPENEEKRIPKFKGLPAYVYKVLAEYIAMTDGLEDEEENEPKKVDFGLRFEDRIAAYYYESAMESSNAFIRGWSELNLNIKNILAAQTARKLGWDAKRFIVGEGDIVDKLRWSRARDFNLEDEPAYLSEVLRIGEEKDITSRERRLDVLKWNWLEDQIFERVFDVESLLAYYLKLVIVARWVNLDEKTGETTFRQIVKTLKQESTESLEEFKKNQKK